MFLKGKWMREIANRSIAQWDIPALALNLLLLRCSSALLAPGGVSGTLTTYVREILWPFWCESKTAGYGMRWWLINAIRSTSILLSFPWIVIVPMTDASGWLECTTYQQRHTYLRIHDRNKKWMLNSFQAQVSHRSSSALPSVESFDDTSTFS